MGGETRTPPSGPSRVASLTRTESRIRLLSYGRNALVRWAVLLQGGAAMTEPQKLTDLVPVEVLTEVNTAIAVLEIQGPAITEALRQLDRATTMAWKAVNMLGVTDEEWKLAKREIGIERGWDAAYQLVSTFDLPSMQPSADVTADGP
jgi:hypothetical protein